MHKNGVHQTVPPLTFTVMTWSTELLDQTGAFSSHRFQPVVAGIYLITATLLWQAPTNQQRCLIYIAKNGGGTHAASIAASGTGPQSSVVMGLLALNGTTDYVEILAYHNAAGAKVVDGGTGDTYFSGALLCTT